jgi:hypothetical protein
VVCVQAQTAKGTGSAASTIAAARVGVACGAMGEPAAIGCADTPNIQTTPEIQHGGFAAQDVGPLDPSRVARRRAFLLSASVSLRPVRHTMGRGPC